LNEFALRQLNRWAAYYRMTDFEKDVPKIVLDKALLGVIAMAFGFYLSRLLEDHRTKRSYELFVSQQTVDACRRASGLIAKHFQTLMGLYDVLDKVARARPGKIPESEAEPAYTYIREYQEMERELHALAPFLPSDIFEALGPYFDETNKLADIVNGKSNGEMPSKDDLLMALCIFNAKCSASIGVGPFAQRR